MNRNYILDSLRRLVKVVAKLILCVCGIACTVLGGLATVLLLKGKFNFTFVEYFICIVTCLIFIGVGIMLLCFVFKKGKK